MREVRRRRANRGRLAQVPRGRGGTVQIAQAIHHPFRRLGVGRPRGKPARNPGRGNHRHLALHAVQHRDDRGADQFRIGQAQRVGVHLRQVFHQPDHVIAEITEEARRHRRQPLGHLDPAFRQKVAQSLQRVAGKVGKGLAVEARLAVDAAFVPVALPDEVRLHPDDGVAAPDLATRDRFQHEGIGPGVAQFQHQADRSIQVRRQPGPDDLVLSGGPPRLELGKTGGKLHQGRLVWTALIAAWSRLIPASEVSALVKAAKASWAMA